MPTITVLAPDSALAMDEVVRQLGGEAYILSTSQQDGMVQIKATNDPGTATPKRASAVKTIFEDEMDKQFAAAGRGRVSVAIEDPVDGGSPSPVFMTASERPQLVAMDGGLTNGARRRDVAAPRRDVIDAPVEPEAPIVFHSCRHTAAKDAATDMNGADPAPATPAGQAKPPIADRPQDPLEDRLMRLEAALGLASVAPGAPATPQTPPPAKAVYEGQELIDAGLDAYQVKSTLRDLPARTPQALVSALAARLVSNTSAQALKAAAIVVVGPSGGGKTTLAAKFAALLNEVDEGRALGLVNLTDGSEPQSDVLSFHGRVMNVPVETWDIGAAGDWTAPSKDTVQIIDAGCMAGQIKDIWPRLQDHFAGRTVHVVMAMPSGLAASKIAQELAQYQEMQPEIVLTKLDECECALPEMSEFLIAQARVGWLSGTRNLVDNLAQATTEILEQYLQFNMASDDPAGSEQPVKGY